MRSIRLRFHALWLVVPIVVCLLVGAKPRPAFADSISCSLSIVPVGQFVTCSASWTPVQTVPNSPQIRWGDGSAPTAGAQGTHAYTAPGTYTVSGELCFMTAPACGVFFDFASTTITVTAQQPPAPSPTASPAPSPSAGMDSGVSVQAQAGWNLLGGPTGTVFGANGPLYSLGSGDSAYVSSAGDAPVAGGRGYWAFFATEKTVRLNGAGESNTTIQAPAGQWVLIGNPSGVQAAIVGGADEVLAWSPADGSYQSVTRLALGQGAWAISLTGGPITLNAVAVGTN